MRINVKHIAELSRITLSEEELEKFTPQMETILGSASVLQEVNTDHVNPMKSHIPLSNLREDSPQITLTQADVLANAKHSENGQVKIYGKVFGAVEES